MSPEQPIDIWREKLEELRRAEATAADTASKFKIRKDIEEAEAKIAELEQEPGSAGKSTSEQVRVTPKGLLSYDAKDADFFLELLPPPLDRGLPRCVRFWKDRIEERDPDSTFRIGLLFGPSGCGKSSLVKAGLIPHLQESVVSVYVESTPDDTEARLLKALRQKLPDLPQDLSVEEALPWVAESREKSADRKVLVVLDQFEQWLHAHRTEQDTALVRALQACDGTRLQCLLMIRVEFQTAAFRLAERLETDWRTDRNMKLVDLFDSLHARKVLADFGRSYGRLPEDLDTISDEQNQFLDQTVASLADEDGRIVAVRLTLFAEMIKGRPWTPPARTSRNKPASKRSLERRPRRNRAVCQDGQSRNGRNKRPRLRVRQQRGTMGGGRSVGT
jgi:hypothetical protein